MQTEKPHEYKNDFLYFTIRPGGGENTLIYCSGVNTSLFSAITRGRHGIGSNPAVRGLQLTNHGVRELSLSRGATPRALRGNYCAGIAPTADVWYAELLAIDNATDSLPDEIIHYGVMTLLEKIFRAIRLELQLPVNMSDPQELQVFLETERRKYAAD